MEVGKQLFLVITDQYYEQSLYRITDPSSSSSSSVTIGNHTNYLGEPLIKMRNPLTYLEQPSRKMGSRPTFPTLMSFAAIGSRIFFVGGRTHDGYYHVPTNKVYIYDTVTSKLVSGPPLNTGKSSPHLITLGSKLFALSTLFWGYPDDELERKPRFEMLDTKEINPQWSALPSFTLNVSKPRVIYSTFGLAAVCIRGSSLIFLSVDDSPTYVFDVDKLVWKCVSDERLPICKKAESIPHDPSSCCAFSRNSNKMSIFRFHYEGDENNCEFQVTEIQIDDSYTLSRFLPHHFNRWSNLVVFGPNGRVYHIIDGVDKANDYRHLKIYALKVSDLKLGSNTKHYSLKRCTDKKRRIRCDEEQDDKFQSSKRRRKEKRQQRRHTCLEEDEERRIKEVKFNGLWSKSFFLGPLLCDPLDPVLSVDAFSM